MDGEIGLESELAELSRQSAVPAAGVAVSDGDEIGADVGEGFDVEGETLIGNSPVVESLVGGGDDVADFAADDIADEDEA